MKTAHILLLCIFGATLLSSVICSSQIGPNDCCYELYPRRLKKTLIDSYRLTDHQCPKPAIILVTKKGQNICADPSLSWVEDIRRSLDENL